MTSNGEVLLWYGEDDQTSVDGDGYVEQEYTEEEEQQPGVFAPLIMDDGEGEGDGWSEWSSV